MLRQLLFSSLVTLSSLYLATLPSIASERYASKDSSQQAGSVPV